MRSEWTASFASHLIHYCAALQPVLTFDLGNSVGDVGWSPHSSTVFAAVTTDGKVRSMCSGGHDLQNTPDVVQDCKIPQGITWT